LNLADKLKSAFLHIIRTYATQYALTTYLYQPWLPLNNYGRCSIVTSEHC